MKIRKSLLLLCYQNYQVYREGQMSYCYVDDSFGDTGKCYTQTYRYEYKLHFMWMVILLNERWRYEMREWCSVREMKIIAYCLLLIFLYNQWLQVVNRDQVAVSHSSSLSFHAFFSRFADCKLCHGLDNYNSSLNH